MKCKYRKFANRKKCLPGVMNFETSSTLFKFMESIFLFSQVNPSG